MSTDEPESPPRTLIPGKDASTWPDLRIERARSHLRDLASRVAEYSATAPATTTSHVRAENPHVVDFRLVVRTPPPVEEWALFVGDGLHNLRSALDALAWEIAHLDGASPSYPKRVYFPICKDEDAWAQAERAWIGEIPEWAAARFKAMQPFSSVGAEGEASALEMLHHLDIADKHKQLLTVRTSVTGVDFGAGGVAMAKVPGSHDMPELLPPALPSEFVNGSLVLSIDFKAPVEQVWQGVVAPIATPFLEWEGAFYQVPNFVWLIADQVAAAVHVIRNGPSDNDGWSVLEAGNPPRP